MVHMVGEFLRHVLVAIILADVQPPARYVLVSRADAVRRAAPHALPETFHTTIAMFVRCDFRVFLGKRFPGKHHHRATWGLLRILEMAAITFLVARNS